jgi:hypothetical protein
LWVGQDVNNASSSKNHVKKYSQDEMLPLETKQSGGKTTPPLGSPAGSVSGGSITQQAKEKGDFVRYMEC